MKLSLHTSRASSEPCFRSCDAIAGPGRSPMTQRANVVGEHSSLCPSPRDRAKRSRNNPVRSGGSRTCLMGSRGAAPGRSSQRRPSLAARTGHCAWPPLRTPNVAGVTCQNPNYLAAVPRAPIRPATTSNAEPMIDARLRRGVDVSWTSDGRGGGRRGSPAGVPPPQLGLLSVIASRRRPELANQSGTSQWGR